MARIEEKTKTNNNKNLIGNVFLWVGISVVLAIIITLVVLIIIWAVNKNKHEDSEYKETYENAELITFEDLEKLLDVNENSSLRATNMYIYVYSPDYDTYTLGKDETIQQAVNDCIDTFKTSESSNYAFYVINVTTEDNTTFLTENTDFLTSNSLSTSYPYLLEITNGYKLEKTYTGRGDIINGLSDALEEVKNKSNN